MTGMTRWKMTTLQFLMRSSARFWPFSAVSTRDCILIHHRNRESFAAWYKASLCICLPRRYCHPGGYGFYRILSFIVYWLAFACALRYKRWVFRSLSSVQESFMNLTKSLVCSLMIVLSLASAQSLFAQGTDLGTIRGLVTDA